MYYVSRQVSTYTGGQYVEIAAGGRDYANPGMLSPRLAGEGEEYVDPILAVQAALSIASQWSESEKADIYVYKGHTGGDTRFFCDEQEEPADHATNRAELMAWAQARAASLPRCDECGEVLGKDSCYLTDYYEERFCREYCAEEWLARQQEDAREFFEEAD